MSDFYKYKVGDLINKRWGNVDHFGYINKLCERTLEMAFFDDDKIIVVGYDYFDRYYMVVSDETVSQT